MTTYLVTGGSGFIGSNHIRRLHRLNPDANIVNLDKLTYAGNPANLAEIEASDRYHFVRGDICDTNLVDSLYEEHRPDVVINFAAESHVDRSLHNPRAFIHTDMLGVFTLLEAARKWPVTRFIQISTDEVYGSIDKGSFHERSPLEPNSPYAASKAGGDCLAHSYFATYKIPVVVTRASNNYGPFQYPEKLISLFVTNLLDGLTVPVYGDGSHVRDWLHVEDHCSAIDFIIEHGVSGEVYNIGGGNEWTNMQITRALLKQLNLGEERIRHVTDRPGHDQRYSLNTDKLRALGWMPQHPFEENLAATVDWYREHRDWWEPIKSGAFASFYKQQYQNRQE